MRTSIGFTASRIPRIESRQERSGSTGITCVCTAGISSHANYFQHVVRMPGFAPRITFSSEPSNESQARERRQLWPAGDGIAAERWEPAGRDVLFLAGVDWRYLIGNGLDGRDWVSPAIPR